jgi:hypothetical protein
LVQTAALQHTDFAQLFAPSQVTPQEAPLHEMAPAHDVAPLQATTIFAASLMMAPLHEDRPEHSNCV